LRAKRNPRLGECTKNDHVVPKFTDRTPHLPREIVLGRIASVVKKFVYKISIARGLSEAAANAAGGKIYTFGSYRLGVHGPGSDIDTLCVVPKHVNREDFFEVFEGMLKDVEGVTEVSVSSSLYNESPRMC
jgi:poly(A) polymerase Pap1